MRNAPLGAGPKKKDGDKGSSDVQVLPRPKTKTRLKRPKRFKVLLHNDHYTPREFVVDVLKVVFHRDEGSSRSLMWHIHRFGVGVAGVYTKGIAETKVALVMGAAEEAGHPLLCTMEPEDDGEEGDGK